MNSKRNDVVLVVDDSPDALSLINDTLEQSGFYALVALEGKQALTIARSIRPDMVLLDAIMPVMDGFETCRALKQIPDLAGVPVIFMTGLKDSDSIVKGLQAGGVDYLTKPINPDELIARMRVHLSNARITSNAYSAVESTGQTLFSINNRAEMTWATPQTLALFARARISAEWRATELPEQLREWLARNPAPNQTLSLDNVEYKLGVSFVKALEGGELLLRLEDNRQVPGESRLRQELKLTERESEVLYWISNGKTNREIGEILGMKPRTVNKHLEQIFPKLGVENRTAAARVALRVLSTPS